MKPKPYFFSFLSAMIWLAFLSSCATYKNITYLKDIPNSANQRPVEMVATGADSFQSIRIQPNDLLQVSIHTLDAQVNAILNQSSEGIGATNNNSGVLVDKDGVVVLPVLGKVKVGGLTTAEARDTINAIANLYLKDPIVNVRIANFKVTVIGEVARPLQYIIPDEKVSVFDAIGLAGDLTIYGKRDNVMLIRHEKDKKKYIRLDLGASAVTNSSYFYLKQGDILYVEPLKVKSTLADPRLRNISILSSIISVISLILAFKK